MKDLFEKINITDITVVLVLGVATIICALNGQQEGMLALGGALGGYLGGHVTTLK